jgi:hypothetical protein
METQARADNDPLVLQWRAVADGKTTQRFDRLRRVWKGDHGLPDELAFRLGIGFGGPLCAGVLIAHFTEAPLKNAYLSLGLLIGVVFGSWLPTDAPLDLNAEKLPSGKEKLSEAQLTSLVPRLATYIDGKMKRYSLLFSVNGGAFAIAKLLNPGNNSGTVAGKLDLKAVALGAVLFTALMTYDIWLWGDQMRRRFIGKFGFSYAGRAILLSIAGLLLAGWALVAFV